MKTRNYIKLVGALLVGALLVLAGTVPVLAQQSIDVDPADMLRRPVSSEVYQDFDRAGLDLAAGPYLFPRHASKISLGLGMGLDYGGLGMNMNYYPFRNVGVFAGVGYPFQSVGFNAGLRFRHIPMEQKGKVNPYGVLMYGYNTSVAVTGAEELNRLFYGFTLGAGVDIYPWSNGGPGYLSFGLLVPLRNLEVSSYLQDLDARTDIELSGDLFPIGITVGFKFFLQRY